MNQPISDSIDAWRARISNAKAVVEELRQKAEQLRASIGTPGADVRDLNGLARAILRELDRVDLTARINAMYIDLYAITQRTETECRAP